MNKEINKKSIKMASNRRGGFAVENRIFQEIKELKKDVKEVKKFLDSSNKEKGIVLSEQIKTRKENVKIIKLEIQEDKLITQLSDGRGAFIPLDWFAKWGIRNITADKLKNYEIWRGKNIYFIDINEVLGIEKFIDGFDSPCK